MNHEEMFLRSSTASAGYGYCIVSLILSSNQSKRGVQHCHTRYNRKVWYNAWIFNNCDGTFTRCQSCQRMSQPNNRSDPIILRILRQWCVERYFWYTKSVVAHPKKQPRQPQWRIVGWWRLRCTPPLRITPLKCNSVVEWGKYKT